MSLKDAAKAAAAKKRLGFTDAEVEKLKDAAAVTYNAIAYDLSDKLHRMSRKALIQVLLDCNWLEQYGLEQDQEFSKKVTAAKRNSQYADLALILRTEFTGSYYDVGPYNDEVTF